MAQSSMSRQVHDEACGNRSIFDGAGAALQSNAAVAEKVVMISGIDSALA
jgi:hypothetical protein